MKVSLIDYTGKGSPSPDIAAAALLIFTKSTRLQMSPSLMDEILRWPAEKKLEELKYMANTIPSSWEFVHFTFMIEGVTRAFTHQFVRSRQWSFAQQTMRVLDVKGWEYGIGPSIGFDKGSAHDAANHFLYKECMEKIARTYDQLIANGVKIEDARGVLPTNILTNIVGSCNMRTFVETVRKRSSPRTQDEYRLVLDAMKAAAIEVYPWLTLFIERDLDKAIEDLQGMINQDQSPEMRTSMTKLLDQIRSLA